MDAGRPSLRILVILLAAAIPPLVVFSFVLQRAPRFVEDAGMGTTLLLASAGAIVWAAVVSVVASRVLANEIESMVHLAERGIDNTADERREGADDGMSAVQRRLAASLEERNHQIASLVALVRSAPIADEPRLVAMDMVRGARELTGDPTWVLAVLRSEEGGALPTGVYGVDPSDEPGPIEDVHRWAATVGADGASAGAHTADGPWGSFALVDVSAGDDLRAILMAPREGRPPPSPADLNLFSLLGQQTATAVEHAMLYGRLRRQTDDLNRMAAVQSDFLRGVTHDLQTPLTRIGVLATELRRGNGVNAAAREDLEIIEWQADRLRRMVGQLLAVSRLEAGALTPRQEIFSSGPIIERTWAALHAAEHSLEVRSSGPPHLLVGDPDRFEQVLWAVLDNAIKYSPAGGSIRILRQADRDPGTPHRLVGTISVTDEGAGMDAETARHAFDQFYRSKDARRLAPDGSGIGLYAARGLLQAMGGDIGMETQLGAGTTVVIRLPAEPASEADEPPGSAAPD